MPLMEAIAVLEAKVQLVVGKSVGGAVNLWRGAVSGPGGFILVSPCGHNNVHTVLGGVSAICALERHLGTYRQWQLPGVLYCLTQLNSPYTPSHCFGCCERQLIRGGLLLGG